VRKRLQACHEFHSQLVISYPYRYCYEQVGKLSQQLEEAGEKMRNIDETALEKALAMLTPSYQDLVKACVKSSRAKMPCGKRYNPEWVYDCIRMRIKSAGLYRQLIRNKHLPLPSERTLQRYLRKLKPAYGFQQETFRMIQQKAQYTGCSSISLPNEIG